ncbi:MAG: esterase family protein [Clostridiales bacterium]|nr:esterase family protein [Clostridiales bacterium]
MAFLQIQFFSAALNVASTVNVIMPEANQGIGIEASKDGRPPKVLYLLHGYSDDHSIWMRRTSVERYAAKHNLAVIMPAVNHSFYCNEVYGENYWDYVSDELPRTMQRFLRLSDRPEDTYVAGLSMGGYGAMRLALTYPDHYAGAASFSGAVDLAGVLYQGSLGNAAHRVFGDLEEIKGTEYDTFHLMEKNANAPRKPWLYVSCGTKDFLFDQHKAFVSALRKNGWEVLGHEEPDVTHEWSFWDTQIQAFIELIAARE